jgi:photosystem II stability/assembly factor-like uncharacterized protein
LKKIFLLSVLFLCTSYVSAQPEQLNQVYFINSDTGWVTGNTGYIFRTTDGGSTWLYSLSGTSANLSEIFFTDALQGFVIGNNGTILKTTDGGISWALKNSTTTENLNSIWFSDQKKGTICGNNGIILRTLDAGETWISQISGTAISLDGVCFKDDSTGFISGNNIILKTTNGGAGWNSIIPAFAYYSPSHSGYLNQNTWVFSVNQAPSVLITTDEGVDWILLSGSTATMSIAQDMFILNDSTLYIAAYKASGIHNFGAQLLKSTDRGVTWETFAVHALDTPFYNRPLHIHFTDSSNGFMVGSTDPPAGPRHYTILKTTNGGTTWEYQYVTMPSDVSGINNSPVSYQLEQNYPNPFNPVTNIEYQVSEYSFVELKVYDSIGREVITLVSGHNPPGRYTVSLDASNMPSGVYFYRLKAGEYTSGKKMIVLK